MLPDNMRNLQLNQKIIIENDKELLLGTVVGLHTDYTYIELGDVVELVKNYSFANTQIIPLSIIQRILILKKHNAEEQINVIKQRVALRTRLCMPPQDCSVLTTPNNLDTHPICVHEWAVIDRQLANTVVIKQADRKYHDAVSDIRGRSVIGLQIHPWQAGRNKSMAIMTIITNTHVYIFDMLALGDIFTDMRTILSQEMPRKILYRSNYVCDMLQHRYNLRLQGVFDIYVAYCLAMRTNENDEFYDIAAKVLQVPQSYFEWDKNFNCFERPFEEQHYRMLAKSGIMLGKIYTKLLYEYMLDDYTKDEQQLAINQEKGEEDLKDLVPI